MRRLLAFATALLFSTAVIAGSTIRFGSRLISVGDSEGMVLRIAGKPSSREPIENRFGALRGYRLEYDFDNKTVFITVIHGRVSDIQEIYR
ncbi:DUF2845 domain-containing protein [Oleiagrimonas sp. MCCC 1A03011]|jgi:hypothetical protein|uniref:DUF2845 domain-containing protein n=1 Tax=Oleiagrimonas sp. MCCC 1A03011 TaxID=1926883 RepID=UPI000DC3AB67|nr:DUF2845 domain-containing protein [Oleiagrimonas sp. MCCC 1A03011]RAP59465.1 hypothetical protein BTJ49_02040 [Oleiagrimonas sp. MCCC 1A03011]